MLQFLRRFACYHVIVSQTACQKEFAFELPSVILARHSEHFLIKYKACDNAFCKFA